MDKKIWKLNILDKDGSVEVQKKMTKKKMKIGSEVKVIT